MTDTVLDGSTKGKAVHAVTSLFVTVTAVLAVNVGAQSASAPYVNPHAAEPIGSVRQMYDGKLSADEAVRTFRNIDRLFPVRVIRRGPSATPLRPRTRALTDFRCRSRGRELGVDEYMTLNSVTGLLVLKNEQIALERYAAGNTAATRWMSMSIAKSITSTLIGAAIKDGRITSINDPVTKYVPSLTGTAYDGVSVRNVLMMRSGVKWNETYTDPTSDRRKLLDIQIAQQPGAAIAFMGTLPRAQTPGAAFNYSTGETLVAGEIVRGATGMSVADYFSTKIWVPAGMESDASWWLDSSNGHEISGSGVSATLRDYGRLGLLLLHNGVINGDSILPRHWMADAGSPKRRGVRGDGAMEPYGYMWWIPDASAHRIHAQAYSGVGIFGQHLYINPREQLVIVQWSALTQPSGEGEVNADDCFAAIGERLR
jgi:CubicO group peptidase (beta-lactamase class C family)